MKPVEPDALGTIIKVLDESTELSLATCRPDGFPQATTLNFVHDQLNLYCAIGLDSQKAHNIRANNKVSATVNRPRRDWRDLQGVSIGGTARIVDDPQQMRMVAERMLWRYPHIRQFIQGTDSLPWEGMLFIEIVPAVVSILDYRKRFGNTELIEVG